MELEQLHEAGSSQAEARTAAEKGIAALSDKVSQLEDVVREKKALFEEADGERGVGWATRALRCCRVFCKLDRVCACVCVCFRVFVFGADDLSAVGVGEERRGEEGVVVLGEERRGVVVLGEGLSLPSSYCDACCSRAELGEPRRCPAAERMKDAILGRH